MVFTNLYLFDENSVLNELLSEQDKISYLDFKIAYLQYQRSKNEFDKKEYISRYLPILKQRSEYKQESTFDVKKPIDPVLSHDSAKVSFSYDSNNSVEFSAKPVYNSIYDIDDGYLEGAYIDFFEVIMTNFIVFLFEKQI